MGNKIGRPPKYETVEQMQEVIDQYFADCDPHMEEVTEWVQARTAKGKLKLDKHGLPYLVEVTHKVMTTQRDYNMAGLALALDMSTQALRDYKKKDEFLGTIKRAKQIVENYKVGMLTNARNVAGVIFDLKVNHEYKENPDDAPPPDNPIVFINNVPIGTDPEPVKSN